MHQQNLDRLRDYLRSHGRQAALLSNPATITWLTGYAPPIQSGASPFDGGPALGWYCDGELTLILSDGEADAARETGVAIHEYIGYAMDQPLSSTERQVAVWKEFLKRQTGLTGSVAVELNTLTVPLYVVAQDMLTGATLQPSDAQLSALRAVKTVDELAKIRAALKLCDVAQANIQQHVHPGVSELALWGPTRAQLDVEAGTGLIVLADLVAGARAGDLGGPPSNYQLQPGDSLIFDAVIRLNGYWGDNAGTYFAGDAPAELDKVYKTVREALYRGIDMVRPGLRASDLDKALRDAIRKAGYPPHPYYSGHGLGATYHEEPRIVPYNDDRLETGMVIALEPGVYLPGIGGVRLQHALLVTADGCEVLTRHLESGDSKSPAT